MANRQRPGAVGPPRGQTSLDFLVGMSVFLIAVAFVLGFLPGLFQPFAGDAGEDLLVADRTAGQLSEGMLGSPARPMVLNDTCTVEFFDADTLVGDCRFDADADDLPTALGLRPGTRANVTVEEAGSAVTLEGTELAAGDVPPPAADMVRAERVVLVGGDDHRLVVRVW